MAKKTTFVSGDRVKVKGKPGAYAVTYAMTIPVPAIANHQFVLVDTEMYKFITDKETFYAYAKDLKKAK